MAAAAVSSDISELMKTPPGIIKIIFYLSIKSWLRKAYTHLTRVQYVPAIACGI
jgi:hypothetical protein